MKLTKSHKMKWKKANNRYFRALSLDAYTLRQISRIYQMKSFLIDYRVGTKNRQICCTFELTFEFFAFEVALSEIQIFYPKIDINTISFDTNLIVLDTGCWATSMWIWLKINFPSFVITCSPNDIDWWKTFFHVLYPFGVDCEEKIGNPKFFLKNIGRFRLEWSIYILAMFMQGRKNCLLHRAPRRVRGAYYYLFFQMNSNYP